MNNSDMNRRNFFKKSFKCISLFSIFYLPFNIFLKTKKFSINKFYKNHKNKIWILRSDDF